MSAFLCDEGRRNYDNGTGKGTSEPPQPSGACEHLPALSAGVGAAGHDRTEVAVVLANGSVAAAIMLPLIVGAFIFRSALVENYNRRQAEETQENQ